MKKEAASRVDKCEYEERQQLCRLRKGYVTHRAAQRKTYISYTDEPRRQENSERRIHVI